MPSIWTIVAFFMLSSPTLAKSVWVESGPEAGHVIDVAVGKDKTWATTRAGVLNRENDNATWRHFTSFPINTQLIAESPSGTVWATTRDRLLQWTPGSGRATAVAALPEGTLSVSLVANVHGVFVAIRGTSAGIYYFPESSTGNGTSLQPVLENVDPWRLSIDPLSGFVAAATLDAGLWVLEEGAFEQIDDHTSISSVAYVDGELWHAEHSDDGPSIIQRQGEPVCEIDSGTVISMAAMDGRLICVMDSINGPSSKLRTCGAITPKATHACGESITVLGSENSANPRTVDLHPTGLWTLKDGDLLVGSFRRGPFRVESNQDGGTSELSALAIRTDRSGFRSTIASGVTEGPKGLVVALMSTGVFEGPDEKGNWAPLEASKENWSLLPVSDVMSLTSTNGTLFAVDFEGVSIRDTDGNWSRFRGVYLESGGRRNGLMQVVLKDPNTLLARDYMGNIWESSQQGWQQCKAPRTDRIDQQAGSALPLLATSKGLFVYANCQEYPQALRVGSDGNAWSSMGYASGDWVATTGKLFYKNEVISSLPNIPVAAMNSAGERTVLALLNGNVLLCSAVSKECTQPTTKLPSPINDIGWLDDDTIWAAQERGTLLIAKPEESLSENATIAEASFTFTFLNNGQAGGPSSPSQDGTGGSGQSVGAPNQTVQLLIPPWRGLGSPGWQMNKDNSPKGKLQANQDSASEATTTAPQSTTTQSAVAQPSMRESFRTWLLPFLFIATPLLGWVWLLIRRKNEPRNALTRFRAKKNHAARTRSRRKRNTDKNRRSL